MLRNRDRNGTELSHWAGTLSLWLAMFLILCCCGLVQAATANFEQQFEEAFHREVVLGDLTGSVNQYRKIVNQPGVDRRVAARALLQVGLCQEKMGQREEAYTTYTRLIADFKDQTPAVNRAQVKLAAWSAPKNLRFEEGVPGKVPPGWFVPSLPKDADYLAELRRDHCRSRFGCAVVRAPANVPRPTGNLMQNFSAAAYAGKRVRLRAWLRLESFFVTPAMEIRLPNPEEDRAQLFLTVERADRGKGFSEDMHDRPVRSQDWTECEIVGDIDADARFINLGVWSIGGGRVWIDNVSFEVIPKP
jgi:Tetratricopeptide repeat